MLPLVSISTFRLFSARAVITFSISSLNNGSPPVRVIGLSKIARIADMVSKRLQLQERIGSDIADIMQMVTGAEDIAVLIEGCHSCMTARGIKKTNTKTYTQTLRGRFNNESNGFVQWWNR